MFNLKTVAIAVLIAFSLVGCAKQSAGPLVGKPNPPHPEPPKFNVVKPEKPSQAPAPFTITTRDGWKQVNYTPLKPEDKDPQLVAIFENDLDEELSVRAGIVAGHLTSKEADSYLEDIYDTAHERENVKVFKERIFKLGTLRAYELVEARVRPTGPQIFVTLAVTDGKIGYVVSCGGEFESAERILPVCTDFVEGFRIVGK